MMKVAEGVYRVPARAANAYLVEADNGLVLVDTGLPGSEKRILKAIEGLGRKPADVKLILLTHRHLDHIGSAAALKGAQLIKRADLPLAVSLVVVLQLSNIVAVPLWAGRVVSGASLSAT